VTLPLLLPARDAQRLRQRRRLATSGIVGIGFAEEMAIALGQRF
jgi:hypothetical protein